MAVSDGRIVESGDVSFLSEQTPDTQTNEQLRDSDDFDFIIEDELDVDATPPSENESTSSQTDEEDPEGEHVDQQQTLTADTNAPATECQAETVSNNDTNIEQPTTRESTSEVVQMTRQQMQQFMLQNPNASVRALGGRPVADRQGQPGRPQMRYRYHIAYLAPNKIVDDALSGPESKEWRKAMDEEYDALIRNGTWILAEAPTNTKAIKTRWVLTKKNEANGMRYKARLVVRAFAQPEETIVGGTYAPVIRASSIKMLLSYALKNQLKIHHVDVKSAYLNAPLDEEVYIEQPYRYENGKRNLVCKLQKAMYGLKQAARCWNNTLTKILKDLGLAQFQSEECIYASKGNNLIVGAYVDDLLIISDSDDVIANFKKRLIEKVLVTDNGELTKFVGIDVKRSENEISLSQRELISELIEKENLQDSNGVHTPMATGTILEVEEPDTPYHDIKSYQSIVGSLMYIAGSTRPDIQFVANQLGKFMSNPMDKHMKAAKRVVRYLKRTLDTELVFKKNDSNEIVVYADADFGGDGESLSTSGVAVFYSENLIGWSSVKQKMVALSTCKAEINAILEGATEVAYYRDLLSELQLRDIDHPSTIFNDNQPASEVLKFGGKQARSRHYKRRINFVKKLIENKEIDVDYVPTTEMLADSFTKLLPENQFVYLMSKCGLKFPM